MTFFRKILDDDHVAMALTAIAVILLMGCFAWPVLPHIWDEMSVASHLRIPSSAFPGLWRGILSILYANLPPLAVEALLRTMGLATGGLLALLVFSTLDKTLPFILRVKIRGVARGRLIVRVMLSLGTMLFICNDSVWRMCQGFGSETLHVLMAVVGLRMILSFYHFGRYTRLYWVMLIWGLMAGDGPIGIVFAIATVVSVYRKAVGNQDEKENPVANPIVRRLVIGKMTSIFLLTMGAGLIVNYLLYGWFGGIRQSDSLPVNVVSVCLLGYWSTVRSAMTPLGWLFFFMLAGGPFLVTLLPLKKAMIEDRFIDWPLAVVYFVVGIVSWSQLSGLEFLWFRSWFAVPLVTDDFAVAVMALFWTVTFLWTISVFSKNYHFHSVWHVAVSQFQDAAETPRGRTAVWEMMRQNRFIRLLTRAMPFLVLLSVVPMRGQWTVRRMLDVIRDYVREVVRENGDAKWIVTDGALDLGVELEAAAQGRRLLALSVFSGGSEYDVAIRQRDTEDADDLHALESGASDAMRYWTSDQTNRLSMLSVQLGFERWQGALREMRPTCSGLLARFGDMSDDWVKNGIDLAHSLGERILAAYDLGDPDGIFNHDIRRLFRYVQWRVSYLCRIRCDSAHGDVWGDVERKDESLMEELDKKNAELESIRKRVSWMAEHHGAVLLPREGLKIGLERADFRMAKTFAETVIRSDPEDPHANFAIGMFYLLNEQYARAEPYFLTALKRHQEDPAVLNNLSVVALRMGRKADALAYAERAYRAAPDSKSIARTLDKARKNFGIILEKKGAGPAPKK